VKSSLPIRHVIAIPSSVMEEASATDVINNQQPPCEQLLIATSRLSLTSLISPANPVGGIVSIAAVFERKSSMYNQTTTMDHSYSLRRTLLSYQNHADVENHEMFKYTTGDWPNTVLAEITLEASPPPWARDGWVFTPLDLQLLPNVSMHQNTGVQGCGRIADTLLSSTNVSLTTSAIRGRLQCEAFLWADGTWLGLESPRQFQTWLDGLSFGLVPDSNITDGYFLPREFGWGTAFQTTVLSSGSRPIRCGNKTASDNNAQSAIGYWS
jgi:hypothetical protein